MTDVEPHRDRLLVVEDESHLAESIVENLELEGYEVALADNGPEGLDSLLTGRFDLAILDVMLPGMDGYALCEQARARQVDTPVLFLTARGSVDDRIRGLKAGGDDYLPKPFHLDELLLRCEAILRRSRSIGIRAERVSFDGNHVDFRSFSASNWRGEELELGRKEIGILQLLTEQRGEVVSRDQILDRVWGFDAFPSTRTVDNFVVRLRRAFERDPESPRWIRTVRGVGYRFERED